MEQLSRLKKFYERAELTIVMLRDRKKDIFYNVYSVAELCLPNQPLSEDFSRKGKPHCLKSLNADYTLFIRRVFLKDIEQAIRYYERDGERPVDEITDSDREDAVQDFGDKILTEPDVMFTRGSCQKSPLEDILPPLGDFVRVAVKFNQSREFRELLPPNALLKAGKFVEETLGISLLKRMEFWGSVFLCMPNPYIRRADLKLGRGGKELLVRIRPHSNQSLQGYFLELADERKTGAGFNIHQPIPSEKFVISLPNEPELLHYRIFDRDKNCIAEECCCLIKQVNVHMSLGGAKRIFNVNGKLTEVNVSTYENFSIGKIKESYRDIMTEEEKKRHLKALEDSRVFMYFPGNCDPKSNSRDRAMAVVKEIIGEARTRCIICDPYFSARDFVTYGIMISSTNITLKLISSEEFLQQPLSKTDNTMQGELLDNVLDQVSSSLPVECHVLKGRDHSPLHDRFIIADNSAYLLGSSLAEFGSRATTLFQAPDTEPLYQAVLSWLQNKNLCIPLKTWLAQRKAEKKEDSVKCCKTCG